MPRKQEIQEELEKVLDAYTSYIASVNSGIHSDEFKKKREEYFKAKEEFLSYCLTQI